MKQPNRSRHRTGRLALAAVVSLGLIAGACSKKEESGGGTETTAGGGTETTAAPETTTGGGTDTTAAPETTAAPAKDPVYGGTLVVSGEAEVANAWLPAAMQCDSYCQQRARTFFEPLTATNADLETVGYLVETIEHNDDY